MAGLLVAVLDALLDRLYFYQGQGSFWDLLILDVPLHELWVRGLIVFIFLVFGLAVSRLLARQISVEVALKETEQQKTVLLSHLPGMAYRCRNDAAWTMVYVSDGCRDLTGYAPHELLHNRSIAYNDVIAQVDRKRVFEDVSEALAAGQPFAVVYRIVTSDGETRWVWEHGSGVSQPDGAVEYIEGFITDITGRRVAEDLNAAFLSSSIDGFWLIDAGGKIQDVNDAYCRLVGYTREELLAMDLSQLEVGESVAEQQEHLRRVVTEGAERFEARHRRKDGSIVDLEASVHYTDLMGGRLLAFFRDITERKRFQDALRNAEREKIQILDSLEEMVVYTDTSRRVLWVNLAACDSLGQPREELIGAQYCTPWAPADQSSEDSPLQAAIETGKSSDLEVPVADGGSWRVRSLPVTDNSGRIIGALETALDMTPIRKAEEQALLAQVTIDHAAIPFFWIQPGGHIHYVNDAACELLRYTREEFLQLTLSDLDARLNDDMLEDAWQNLRAKGTDHIESVHRAKDGTLIPVDITTVFMEYAGREYSLAMVQDMRPRKKAEARLTTTEALLQAAIEQSPAGIMVANALLGDITLINTAAQRLLGETAESITEASLSVLTERWQVFHPDGTPMAPEDRPLARAFATGETIHNEEIIIRNAGGQESWVSVNAAPIYDSAGEIKAAISVFSDVTDRRLAEQALKDSEGRLRTVIQQSPYAMVVYDKDGHRLTANDAWRELSGESDENPQEPYNISENPQMQAPPIREKVRRALTGERVAIDDWLYDPALSGQSRRPRWLRSRLYPIISSQGELENLVAVHEDITHHRRIEEAVRSIAATSSDRLGPGFFDLALEQLAGLLGADVAFVGQFSPAMKDRVRTLSMWADGSFVDNIEYVLAGTPCNSILSGASTVYQDGVAELFPEDHLLEELGAWAFAGVPLLAADGKPQGIMAVIFRHRIKDAAFVQAMLRLFATRTAAEMDRMRMESALAESEEKFRHIFESANDAIFLMKGARFVDCNEVTMKVYGCQRKEDIIGHTPWEFSPETQADGLNSREKAEAIVSATISGHPQRFEWKHVKLDGTEFDAEISLSRVEIAGEDYLQAVVRDVSDRVKAERIIREREATLSSIFRAAPTGIGVVSNRVFMEVNDRLCEMVGYEQKELLGKSALVLYETQEEFERVGHEKYQQIDKCGTGTTETRWVRKDGVVLDILLSSTPADPQNLEAGVTFTALDITERKRALMKLAESETWLAQIVDGNSIAAFVIDKNHQVTHWNRAAERMTGITADTVIGSNRHWSAFYTQERPILADLVLDGASEETISLYYGDRWRRSTVIETAYECEAFIPDVGEEGRWLYFTATPLYSADGEVVGAIETLQDTTARREAEQKTQHLYNQLQALVQSMPDAITFKDGDGRIILVNKALCNLVGRPAREIIGRTAAEVALHDRQELLEQSRLTDEQTINEKRVIRSDAEFLDDKLEITYLETIKAPILDDEGNALGLVTVTRDITSRKKTENALRETTQALEAERSALSEKNAALNQILTHLDKEKSAFRERVCSEIEMEIIPLLENVKSDASAQTQKRIEGITDELGELLAKDVDGFRARYQSLTPREREICELIKHGNSSKEISDQLGVSVVTVHKHREHIRRKLKIRNKYINLSTYLHFK